MPQPGIHEMWGAHYLFSVQHSIELPFGAVVAVIGGKRYPVLKACWCTWFSSGDRASWGSMIIFNGRLAFAEKQDAYERIEYADGVAQIPALQVAVKALEP